jgi:hypothetical protein
MRERNLPVSLTPIREQLNAAIAHHEGNTGITAELEKILKDLPDGDTAPFNTVLNFKQGLDQKLRAPAMADPAIASLQRASSALKGTKSALTNVLSETEPEFRKYVTQQAKAMQYLEQSKAASDMIKKSALGTPIGGVTRQGQDEIYPLSGNKLRQALMSKNADKARPNQIKAIENAQKHASLTTRSSAGMAAGSNTAQNLNVKDMVYNDLIKAGFGEGKSKLGNLVRTAGGQLGSLPVIKNVTSSIGQAHAEKLSQIFTQAELNPKYAAELMQKYGLGQMSFSDPAGRAALRSLMNHQGNK